MFADKYRRRFGKIDDGFVVYRLRIFFKKRFLFRRKHVCAITTESTDLKTILWSMVTFIFVINIIYIINIIIA